MHGNMCAHGWVGQARMGSVPSLPAKKFAFAFLQKIFGLNLHIASKSLRHGASSLRGASRRAPKSRIFGLSPTLGSSIRIGSYLFYPEPMMSRAPRARCLCTALYAPIPCLLSRAREYAAPSTPAPPSPILSYFSRGECKIEWRRGGVGRKNEDFMTLFCYGPPILYRKLEK